jgi:hypothetical protein
MFQLVLAIATLIGGIAGVWFFYDKLRTIDWKRPTFEGATREGQSGAAISWPRGTKPNFPSEMREAILRSFPRFRLPEESDIIGEWATYGDPLTLQPFFCSGDFTGSGNTEYAVFLLGESDKTYKVVALTRSKADGLEPHEVVSGAGVPQNMFLSSVKPGNYRPGPSVRKIGSARTIRLRRDAISLGTFESASSILYWNKRWKSFVQVWMSD